MYEKLEENSKKEIQRDNLFYEFDKSIKDSNIINFKEFSIDHIIDKSVENTINDIVTYIINTKTVLKNSITIEEVVKICKNFFSETNFGIFEYLQKTGRSSFNVKHSSGYNGTKFLEKFFERIFNSCLKKYSFHIISDNSHVCIIFR